MKKGKCRITIHTQRGGAAVVHGEIQGESPRQPLTGQAASRSQDLRFTNVAKIQNIDKIVERFAATFDKCSA